MKNNRKGEIRQPIEDLVVSKKSNEFVRNSINTTNDPEVITPIISEETANEEILVEDEIDTKSHTETINSEMLFDELNSSNSINNDTKSESDESCTPPEINASQPEPFSENDTELLKLKEKYDQIKDGFFLFQQKYINLKNDVAFVFSRYEGEIYKPVEDLFYNDKYKLTVINDYLAIHKSMVGINWKNEILSIINKSNGDDKLLTIFKKNIPDLLGVSESAMAVVLNTTNNYSTEIKEILRNSCTRLRIYLRLLERSQREFSSLLAEMIREEDFFKKYNSQKILENINTSEEFKYILNNLYDWHDETNKRYQSIEKSFYKSLDNLLNITSQLVESESGLKKSFSNNETLSEEEKNNLFEWSGILGQIHDIIIDFVQKKMNVFEMPILEGEDFEDHLKYAEVLDTIIDDGKKAGTIIQINSKAYKRILADSSEIIVSKATLTVSRK